MAWRPRNLSDALLPMVTLYAIIGHGIFQFPIGRQRVLFSRAYALIMGFLYYSVLIYVLTFVGKLEWSRIHDIVLSIVALANIGIAIIAQINNWYHSRTWLRILKKLMMVDETLRKLGANINYGRTMKIAMVVIIYWLIKLFGENLITVFDPRWNTRKYGFITRALYCTFMYHPVHANAIVSLNFALTLGLLGSRFNKLNKLIEDSLDSYYQQPGVDPESFLRYRNSKVNPTLGVSSRRLWQAEENFKSLIQTVKHVHLELMLVSKYHNQIYGLPMALETACFFVSFTGLVYSLFKMITGTDFDGREYRIFLEAVWTFLGFVNFMIINRSCESVGDEAKRTRSLIHGINSSIGNSELHDEINQFSIQVMKNTMCFSPAGLFDFGYPFVLMFVGSVSTYVVILIQSDTNT